MMKAKKMNDSDKDNRILAVGTGLLGAVASMIATSDYEEHTLTHSGDLEEETYLVKSEPMVRNPHILQENMAGFKWAKGPTPNKYEPHQGSAEKARRLKKMSKGVS